MKLKEMIDKGYALRAWVMTGVHGERRIAVKLSKKTPRGDRFYVVHSPQVETVLSDVEFTEPVELKETKRRV
jgi:hypothetical protein